MHSRYSVVMIVHVLWSFGQKYVEPAFSATFSS